MAPTVAPSGSTFQDITRIVRAAHAHERDWVDPSRKDRLAEVWQRFGRRMSAAVGHGVGLGRYHERLLRTYGVAYLEIIEGGSVAAELEGATWSQLVRAALTAGFPVRVDALDAHMERLAEESSADADSLYWSAGNDYSKDVLRPAYLTSCHGCTLPMFTDTTTRHFCNGCLRRHERNKKRNQRGTDLSDRLCGTCGTCFVPKRSTAQFCSTRCRVAAHRAKSDIIRLSPDNVRVRLKP